MKELISNLVDNAIRHTPSGGAVSVRLQISDGQLALSVRDDGPGINSKEHDRIFESFYRIPGTSGVGSGLGLAIVKEIAINHRAEIKVSNLESSGACFDVIFQRGQQTPRTVSSIIPLPTVKNRFA